MAVLQELAKLSGPRKALLGAAALLPCAGALPWYRIEGRGFVVELSGWNDLGVVAWILAIDLVAWELLRIFGVAPVRGDRGDRWSAVGGMAVTAVGGLFALQRATDGALGWGWVPGTVLLGAVGWASLLLFLDAAGPATVAAAVGGGPADDEDDRSAVRPSSSGYASGPPRGAEPPSGGWPKTLAERQRDEPPLWADPDRRGGDRGRSS